jgi:hypothetical protein
VRRERACSTQVAVWAWPIFGNDRLRGNRLVNTRGKRDILPALRLRPQPQGTWRMLERINQQGLMWPSPLWTLVDMTRPRYHGKVGSYPAACWVKVTRSPSTHAGGSDAVL